jgi:predicted  nucleic acid-binding Zn-ribbon protein
LGDALQAHQAKQTYKAMQQAELRRLSASTPDTIPTSTPEVADLERQAAALNAKIDAARKAEEDEKDLDPAALLKRIRKLEKTVGQLKRGGFAF